MHVCVVVGTVNVRGGEGNIPLNDSFRTCHHRIHARLLPQSIIEALQAEKEAMRKKMQDLMKKNQHLEDKNDKKTKKKPAARAKKTQFGQQGVGLD